MTGLIAELRRRNVFRVAAVYGVVGWLIAQIAVLLENALKLPDWFDAIIVTTLLLGFPIAMILAWAFELTPDGFKPTERTHLPPAAQAAKKRNLNAALAAALALALAFIAFDALVLDRNDRSGPAAHAASGDPSIAVLPFADMSATGDQVYFGDGVAEELLNLLAKVDGLKVASRTSAFTFRERTASIGEIAEALDVAHVLEGSVRKAGNQVRITAQLIETASDVHLWSETYDRELTAENLFAIQDEIAQAIVAEVGGRLEVGPRTELPTTNTRAYELYLSGAARAERRTRDEVLAGLEELKQAVTLDPDFFEARIALARAHELAESYAGADREASYAASREQLAAAKALRPDAPELVLARAWQAYNSPDDDKSDVVAMFREAVARNPDSADAHRGLGNALLNIGDLDAAMDATNRALELDPRSTVLLLNASTQSLQAGDFATATDRLKRTLQIDPSFALAARRIADVLVQQGEIVEAHRVLMWKADEPGLESNLMQIYANAESWDAYEAVNGTAGRGIKALIAGDRAEATRYAQLAFAEDSVSAILLGDLLGDPAIIRSGFEAEPGFLAFLTGDAPLGNEVFADAALAYVASYAEVDPDTVAHVRGKLATYAEGIEPGGAANPYVDAVLARYHARTGDAPAMQAALDALLERGFPIGYLTLYPVFDPYRDTPAFRAWEARMTALADAARVGIEADLANPPDPWWDPDAL